MSNSLERFIFSLKLRDRIIQHTIFWLGHLLIFSLLSEQGFWTSMKMVAMVLPFRMLAVYPTLYLFFPRLLLQKKYLSFLGALTLVLLITTIGSHLVHLQLYEGSDFSWHVVMVLSQTIISGYIVSLALGLKFLRHMHLREKLIQDLSQSKLEAELKFLKAQIHPHFLFNTLNNLYTLTLQKSDIAPVVVEKLSDLLRYMSYDANSTRVSLESEIEYLKNYVSLEKLRYGDKLDLAFSVEGKLLGKEIAPLILLPFIENSFKHGASGNIEKSWISIHISLLNDELQMVVENSLSSGGKDDKGYKEGIGLKNVQRRLDLLYRDRYSLSIVEYDTHVVRLKLSF